MLQLILISGSMEVNKILATVAHLFHRLKVVLRLVVHLRKY